MTEEFQVEEIISIAKNTLEKFNLCKCCLGRLFAKKGYDMTNEERGEKVLKKLTEYNAVIYDECDLCSGLCGEINDLVDLVLKYLEKYEFETFLIGSIIDEDIEEAEEKVTSYSKSEYSEPLKREINREVGKRVAENLKKDVDFKNPDITAVIDTAFYVVNFQIKPLFIYGRYKKLKRGIPQTKWYCRTCHGKGCKKCNFTGKNYNESVEELISEKLKEKTKGESISFHGSGREDIDALMLGNGRPFVVEVKNPKKRAIDLEEMEKKINDYCNGKVEVCNLKFCEKDEKVRLKEARFRKKYRVYLKAENPINSEKLKKAVQCLGGRTVKQRTPSRVAHRRADKVRHRQIYNCEIESLEDNIAVLDIETESGTYVKELVSGDEGRTKPNISELVDSLCKVIQLDVMEVKGE
ncbi:MAG: tRNA pseudouridine(54/55) synthase Pus10 [Candidatus Thermoplasmatota archaeon]